MHTAYVSNCASVGSDEPEELDPAGTLDWVVVVLPLARLATTLRADPPPQPVTRKLKAATTARMPTSRAVALVTSPVSTPGNTASDAYLGLDGTTVGCASVRQ